jgi:hypothetical protein
MPQWSLETLKLYAQSDQLSEDILFLPFFKTNFDIVDHRCKTLGFVAVRPGNMRSNTACMTCILPRTLQQKELLGMPDMYEKGPMFSQSAFDNPEAEGRAPA